MSKVLLKSEDDIFGAVKAQGKKHSHWLYISLVWASLFFLMDLLYAVRSLVDDGDTAFSYIMWLIFSALTCAMAFNAQQSWKRINEYKAIEKKRSAE